ncbi:unnamed protein product [Chondrus crispus]|uniref:Uncharacterized protein n=1 Tax=Chondrus crispus TaxID=2769 RepID=R7Q815_CHOCR|nr:unnamed protein product [Chondrus crispus]CDF33953.1 unnamed protein product [Chondrus crispus]|eukprot:XP_005713772.1 unnamed protein product [Chondrus crispus]
MWCVCEGHNFSFGLENSLPFHSRILTPHSTIPLVLSCCHSQGTGSDSFLLPCSCLALNRLALTESVVTSFHNSALLRCLPRAVMTAALYILGFFGDLMVCSDTELLSLDAIDSSHQLHGADCRMCRNICSRMNLWY